MNPVQSASEEHVQFVLDPEPIWPPEFSKKKNTPLLQC